jgi:ribosomal protein S18 acetylase RimI-like enzyme
MSSFILAGTTSEYVAAASMFRAYAADININLDFQHFEEELSDLPKMYGAPHGGIILALEREEVMGCVAIRSISKQEGELKRMYLDPAHRQKGLGKMLLQKALQLARDCQYEKVKLDTLNYMKAAIHLYEQAGFYEIAPYYANPISEAVYFEIEMTSFLGR